MRTASSCTLVLGASLKMGLPRRSENGGQKSNAPNAGRAGPAFDFCLPFAVDSQVKL